MHTLRLEQDDLIFSELKTIMVKKASEVAKETKEMKEEKTAPASAVAKVPKKKVKEKPPAVEETKVGEAVKLKKPRASRSKKKIFVERGKRKRAIARATAREGTGMLKINNLGINTLTSPVEREIISEPLRFVDASKMDVSVNVRGGGRMGQAQAARTAIARALVAYTGDEGLRKRLMEFDRSLLVEDPRRVEPKKFKGPKARARFTKSYR